MVEGRRRYRPWRGDRRPGRGAARRQANGGAEPGSSIHLLQLRPGYARRFRGLLAESIARFSNFRIPTGATVALYTDIDVVDIRFRAEKRNY